MRSKKGFEASQIFVFVVSIIVVGLVLLFGTRAIMNWREDLRQVNYVQFKTDLQNAIDDVAADYGSVKQLDFHVPSDYQHVCFADMRFPMPADRELVIDGVPYPEIKDAWTDSPPTANIFLLDENSARENFKDDRVQVPANPTNSDLHIVCIPRENGNFKVRLEGMGRSVKVSRWHS